MPILQISIIAICILSGAALFVYTKVSANKNEKEDVSKLKAQEFVNVKDIKDRFLYSRDNHIFMYLKINPISIDLYSDREKKQLCRTLTAELSSEREPFKFLAVSRPVDISPLINEYTMLIAQSTNPIQKSLLRNEMLEMSNYALSGEVVERQFYIMIWSKYEDGAEKDIAKRANDYVNRFASGSIRCEVLKEQDIVRLCNLINNPAYASIEDDEFDASIPILA